MLMRPSRSFQRGGARKLCLEEREREREAKEREARQACACSQERVERKKVGVSATSFFHFFPLLSNDDDKFFSSSAFLSLSVSRERETEPLDSSTQAHREPLASLSDHFRRCRAGR